MSSTAACHAVAYAKAGSGRLTTASPSCGGRAACDSRCSGGRHGDREDVVRGLVTGLLPYCVWKA